MTFYLQQHVKGGRWLIDSTFPQNCHKVHDSREASEWLDAKRKFGFPLTAEQERLIQTPLADRLKALEKK